MKKHSAVAVLVVLLGTTGSAGLAADTMSTGNDLHRRVTSLETTVAVLHQDISTLHGILTNLQVALRDLPPPAATAHTVPVTGGCRPPVNRCAQRNNAKK